MFPFASIGCVEMPPLAVCVHCSFKLGAVDGLMAVSELLYPSCEASDRYVGQSPVAACAKVGANTTDSRSSNPVIIPTCALCRTHCPIMRRLFLFIVIQSSLFLLS